MDYIAKEEEKLRMLEMMEENHWDTETNKDSSYEEVDTAYNEMIKEYDAIEIGMYPNGRDYDAENFDD